MDYAPTDGFPDFGNGYFSKVLSYADWLRLNSAERIHANNVEHVFICALNVAVAALNYPFLGFVGAWVMVFGRLLFSLGYYCYGPRGRLVGALITDLGFFYCFGLACLSVFKAVENPVTGEATLRYIPFQ